MTQLRAQLKPLSLPTRQLALPDGDEVSRGLCLQQAEVEADAMTNGDGDQPDAVLPGLIVDRVVIHSPGFGPSRVGRWVGPSESQPGDRPDQ